MRFRHASRVLIIGSLGLLLSLILSLAPTTFARSVTLNAAPDSIANLRLDTPANASLTLAESLLGASGRREVIVRLSERHTSALAAQGRAAQLGQGSRVAAQQDQVIALAQSLDPSARVLGRVRLTLNAVVLEIDAAQLPALASDANVVSINPVPHYELALAETVPYVGATPAVQNLGFRGKDVKLAVLDSGIDYTHAAFTMPDNPRNSGTLAAYAQAYCGNSSATPPFAPSCGNGHSLPDTTGLFGPGNRVVGGYDFVGETWGIVNGVTVGERSSDPNPIDFQGHGTNVADIAGGRLGVAPEVDLYAVKVCSAISTACNGVAILLGLDFAVDPNGDGDVSDRVHIVNMSLGSTYGQNYDDDAAAAVENVSALGTLVVSTGSNSSDKPYSTGTPGAARSALSVAQTAVPSSFFQFLRVVAPAAIAGDYVAAYQPWSTPLTSLIEAPVQYGDGAGGNLLGCNPFAPGSLSGRIVLVDRGDCNFSLKSSNIADAGGLAAVVGLVAPGEPSVFGLGIGNPRVPTYVISQADANRLRSQLANGVTAQLDPQNIFSLARTMVGSSGRGPTNGQMFYGNNAMFGQIIKPEIGAPGASVSAVAGSATGVAPFSGTSGAAPMVAGAAALLFNASNWGLSPYELKSRLMNTAEANIDNRASVLGGGPAPITRIGAGELRVDRAIAAQAAAWEQANRGAALSFGFVDASQASTTLRRTVVVRNYSNRAITYQIQPLFRFSDDIANGAVSISAPESIRVPANSQRTFRVTLTIDGSKLRAWGLNSGVLGASGDTLTTFEYDGYVRLIDSANAANNLHLPWHVLPRLSGDVRGPSTLQFSNGTGSVELSNSGVGTARINAYALIGSSGNLPSGGFGEQRPAIDLKYVGVATFNGSGVCPNNSYILSFAVNNWYRQSHGIAPGQMRINLDTNRDGRFDFQVRNADFSLSQLSDGRALSWVVNLRTGAANALFFTDHGTNSANFVLNVCGSQLSDSGAGLSAPALGQPINVEVEAFDIYFGQGVTDSIKDIVIAPGGERYSATISDIAPGGVGTLTVSATGSTSNSSETGVLLLLDATRGSIKGGAPDGREALAITVNP